MAHVASTRLQQDSLLTTKLHVPRARPNLVPRSRLIDQLNAALAHPVTLVSAPAGSGQRIAEPFPPQ